MSAAASAPNAWDNAVRCGTAVIGIQMAIGAPISEPITMPTNTHFVRHGVIDQQRADNGQGHADFARPHALAGRARMAQPFERQNE